MPEQGPRAVVGRQGCGGAVLTPVRRLTLAGLGVIAGGAIVALGTRLTWVSSTVRSAPFAAPGLPRVTVGGGTFPYDGADVGAGYLFGLGLLCALIPLGWLVAGPRGRVVLGVAGLALAVGIGVGVAVTHGDLVAEARRLTRTEVAGAVARVQIRSGTGSGVTAAGAAVAGLSSLAGAVAGRHIPRLRLPEKPDRGDVA